MKHTPGDNLSGGMKVEKANKATAARQRGSVVWFNSKKGFGFVRPDCECGNRASTSFPYCTECRKKLTDLYVHFSGIADGEPGRRQLEQDQYVEFCSVESPKGPMANQVRVIKPE